MLAQTQTPSRSVPDEKAILQTLARLAAAWVHGDARAVAAEFDPDCDHRVLTSTGRLRSGRDEFQRVFAQAFAGRASREGRALRFSLAGLRGISDGVAVLDGALHFGPGHRRDGRVLPASQEPFTAVMKKHSGGWLIAACRMGPLMTAQ